MIFWWALCLSYWPAQSAERFSLLILGPDSAGFQEVVNALPLELGSEFTITHRIVNERTSFERYMQYIEQIKPQVMVLMDNVSINYYRRYQHIHSQPEKQIPAVAAMALFMDQAIDGLNQVVGIRYEVPAVISLVNLRDLMEQPFTRVGVVYRAQTKPFFEQQKLTCSREQIELIGVEVPSQSDKMNKQLKNALSQLIKQDDVDALWILNDSALLTEHALTYVWLPRIRRFKGPVVVGVRPLVEKVPLGNFAVVPDHQGMGKQIANLIFEMVEGGFDFDGPKVFNPVSVETILNYRQARKQFSINSEKLGQVDLILSN